MTPMDQDRSYEHSAVQFHHPFTCIVAGPTSCGKSVFVENFIKAVNSILSAPFSRILWCYGEWQERYRLLYSQFGVLLHEGLPVLSLFDGKAPIRIISYYLLHEADARFAKF